MIAITMGDGNGVGPEILLKAYVQGELQGEYMVWGDRSVLEYCSRKLGYEVPFHFAKDETDYCPNRLNVLDLGWLTEGEATGILWDLSHRVQEELHSWREFAQSYLFGGLLWKLLCGDANAESYLGFLADASTDLLTGKPEEDEGQWRECPWPAARKIGFQV